MEVQHIPVYAAIDIGSNTIRVVVARCASDHLDILATDEALVRIGESVNATGRISAQKQDETIAVLQRYKALAQEHGAEVVLAVATEAIRKAANREEFLEAIQREVGIEVQIISGDVEAALTFYGATYKLSQEAQPPGQVAVVDLGGGSMELVLAKQLQIHWHTSIPIGSGWVHDRYLLSDPPSADDIATARSFLQTYFQGMHVKRFSPVLIATGGSANTVLLLAQRAFGLPPEQQWLAREDLLRCEGVLCALSAEEVAQRYDLSVKRARILVAGTLILLALVERFKVQELRISPEGIREGILLEYARSGEQWLEQAKQVANAQPAKNGVTIEVEQEADDETFAEAGRRLLRERMKKMLEWHDEVLKNEDPEAVHKMRVASRRLRAVLDAYESICAPKAFKKIYRRTKKVADTLGIARDTDVMIQNLQGRMEGAEADEQAALGWLIERLRGYRQQHQKKVAMVLKKLDESALKQEMRACLPEGGARNGKS